MEEKGADPRGGLQGKIALTDLPVLEWLWNSVTEFTKDAVLMGAEK